MRARVTRAEVLVQSGLTRVPFRPVPGHARRRATSCLGRRSGTDVLRPDSIASVDCTLRVKWNAKLADYDWDALSSAATLLPAPARLTAALDRDECLARHAHLERRERDLDKARQLRTAKAIIGPGKRSSALPQLDSVVLRDGFLFSASSVSLDQPTIGQSFLHSREPFKVTAERTTLLGRQTLAGPDHLAATPHRLGPIRRRGCSRQPPPRTALSRTDHLDHSRATPRLVPDRSHIRYTRVASCSPQVHAGSPPDFTIYQASKNRSSAPSMTDPTTSGSKPRSTWSDSTLAPHS